MGLVLRAGFDEIGDINYEIFQPYEDEEKTLKKIYAYINACSAKKKLSESIYGKFGGRC